MTPAPPETPAVPAESPFVGLIPYSVEQAEYFFGRSDDAALLAANVRSSRLTLLYGPTGVGKTSLISAGLIPGLRKGARANFQRRGKPGFVPVLFRAWQEDPATAVANALHQECNALDPGSIVEPSSTDLEGMLRTWSDRRAGDILLILDQFEMFFVYHANAKDHPLTHTLARCISHPRLSVNVLISIREDWLPALDVFKSRIPSLFSNYLRLRKLERAAASDAITCPVERFNELHGTAIRIAPDLVDAVLARSVEVQPVTAPAMARPTLKSMLRWLRRLPPAAPPAPPEGAAYEAPALQIIMRRLWDEEVTTTSSTLRGTTLARLTKDRDIVDEYVFRVMKKLRRGERQVAGRLIDRLVTPSGTKVAMTVGDLASLLGRSRETITKIIPRLSSLLNDVAPPAGVKDRCYEISHDVLAPALSRWQVAHAHRSRVFQVGAIFGVITAAAVAFVVYVTALNANLKTTLAEKNELEGQLQALNRGIAETAPSPAGTNPNPAPTLTVRDLGVLSRKSLWPPGFTLHVRFLGGSAALREQVRKSALEWTRYANLDLLFDESRDAQVRISFRDDGSWAYQGREILEVPRSEANVNLGFLTDASADEEIGMFTLHEIGHVLGLVHEHHQPNAQIPWNLQKVWATFSGPPNFWDREQIETGLLGRYRQGDFPPKPFDPASVMTYAIPKELTDGRFGVGTNRTLSAGDKRFIAELYPGR